MHLFVCACSPVQSYHLCRLPRPAHKRETELIHLSKIPCAPVLQFSPPFLCPVLWSALCFFIFDISFFSSLIFLTNSLSLRGWVLPLILVLFPMLEVEKSTQLGSYRGPSVPTGRKIINMNTKRPPKGNDSYSYNWLVSRKMYIGSV